MSLTTPAPRVGKRRKFRTDDTWSALLFVLPAVALLVAFVVWPIASTFRLSLLDWNGLGDTARYIGLQNWTRVVQDPLFHKALGNNFLIAILSIAIQIPIALVLAVLLDAAGRRARIFKILYFLPMLMSTVAIGFLFRNVYDPNFGPINSVLRAVGLDSLALDWLGNPNIALLSVIAVICWHFIPFYMVLFLAALSSMPSELREAAVIDGASEPTIFWRIILPFLQGTIRTAIILSIIGSLRYFDLVFVMTGGGPANATELMTTYMYRTVFASFDLGYGSTIAAAMFIVVMITAAIVMRVTRRFQTEI